MIFTIPPVTSTILNSILTTFKKRNIDTSQIEVFKDIACKIAMIQNTESPKLIFPTHYIISIDKSIKESFNTPKEIQNEIPIINSFNNTSLLNINVINCETALGSINSKKTSILDNSHYEKAIKNGTHLALQVHNKGGNCISFGTTCNGSTFSASMLTAEITSTNIEKCVHFNIDYSKNEQETILSNIHKIQALYSPMTLAEIMCTYGEFDIATIVGGMLKAAELKMVILIDSFTTSAALLFAYQLNKNIIDYCIFCNQSSHKGHQVIIDYFEKQTILNLDFNSSIGLAIPLSLPIIQGALSWFNNTLNEQTHS